jgi:hypothetical protein
MIEMNFRQEVNASRERVWQTLTQLDLYKKWAAAFCPDSYFEGEWKEGAEVCFTAKDMGGTRATMEKVIPNKLIRGRHVSMFDKDGNEDDSELARKWIGAIEQYSLSEENGVTTLEIYINAPREFKEMFTEGWGKALPIFKELAESLE